LPFIGESTFLKVDASRVESCAVDGIPIVDTPAALHNTIYGFAWTGHGFAIALGFTNTSRTGSSVVKSRKRSKFSRANGFMGRFWRVACIPKWLWAGFRARKSDHGTSVLQLPAT
jgi:hypothetical protein